MLTRSGYRVLLCEAVHGDIQTRFFGRKVTLEDLEALVELWTNTVYDYIPLQVSLMAPRKVIE